MSYRYQLSYGQEEGGGRHDWHATAAATAAAVVGRQVHCVFACYANIEECLVGVPASLLDSGERI